MMNKKTRKIVCKALRRAGWPTRHSAAPIHKTINHRSDVALLAGLFADGGVIALVKEQRDIDYPNPSWRTVDFIPAMPVVITSQIDKFYQDSDGPITAYIDQPQGWWK